MIWVSSSVLWGPINLLSFLYATFIAVIIISAWLYKTSTNPKMAVSENSISVNFAETPLERVVELLSDFIFIK